MGERYIFLYRYIFWRLMRGKLICSRIEDVHTHIFLSLDFKALIDMSPTVSGPDRYGVRTASVKEFSFFRLQTKYNSERSVQTNFKRGSKKA